VDGRLKAIEKTLEIGARQLVIRAISSRRHDHRSETQRPAMICWTVNHPAHMRLLASAGVAGIMSDYRTG